MQLHDRFKRLSLWNKLGVVGTIASVIGLVFGIPPFVEWLSLRARDAASNSEAKATVREVERLVADGQMVNARLKLAGITPAQNLSAEAKAIAAAVNGIECFSAPSESCLAVAAWQVDRQADSPLSRDVACLLQYRARPRSDRRSPAEWFRQTRVVQSSSPMVRLLVAQEVGMSDPLLARSLLQPIIQDTTRNDARQHLRATAYYALGKTYQSESNWALAGESFETALQMVGERGPTWDKLKADILYGLITIYRNLGDEAYDAVRLRARILELYERLQDLGNKGFDVGTSPWFGEAVQRWRNREYDEAKQVMSRVDDACRNERVFRGSHYRCTYARAFIAMCEIDHGTFSGNLRGELLGAAEEFQEMQGGPYPRELAWCQLLLAAVYQHAGQGGEARRCFAEASSIRGNYAENKFWPEERWQEVKRLLQGDSDVTAQSAH